MTPAGEGGLRLQLIDAACVCLLYIGLCEASNLLSSKTAFAGTASIFFLPAFVRLLGVLVAGWWSVPALFLASYICLDYIPQEADRLTVAAFLATGGPLATLAAMRALQIRPTLQSLRPAELLWLSIACAAGSSAFYNLGLSLAGLHSAPLAALAVTFVGDLAGTWAIIYAIKIGMHAWSAWRRA